MKKFLIIVGVLIAIVCILGLVAPKDFLVEREITINKPNMVVFEYLKSLKNQNQWSVWAKMDPNMKSSYRGTDGTVGFVSAWEGNSDVGKGEQEIKAITEGARIEMELRFMEPFEATNSAYMTTTATGENQTAVKWGLSGKSPFPMNIMFLFMNMDKSLGKDFEEGLANLKVELEK